MIWFITLITYQWDDEKQDYILVQKVIDPEEFFVAAASREEEE